MRQPSRKFVSKNRIALQDVSWSFVGGKFRDRDAFEASLRQYLNGHGNPEPLEPGELAILSPMIRVQYMCWDGDEQIEPVVTLTAENGAAFSVGDLLFQLHNAVVEQLESIDHHFFEGIAFVGPPASGQPPLYRLCQGS